MEINKYTTYCRGLKDHEEYCLPDDVNKLISYHKAVLETMQNKIDELCRDLYEAEDLLKLVLCGENNPREIIKFLERK